MDTLRVLADETDGRAIVNRNDLEAGLKQMVRDSSAYYLLGYNSTQAPHGRQVPRDQGAREAAGRRGPGAQGLLGADGGREHAALAAAQAGDRSRRDGKALADGRKRRRRARVVRTWIGTAPGENGKTRVTFVWEPVPRAAG